jgi:isoleucyl-tRNA synthetase
MVYVSDTNIFNTLFDLDLAEVCITSNAMATNDAAPANAFTLPDVPGVAVVVEKAVGTKCARSWKILPTVGEDAEYPDVSPRDAQALREWKTLAEGDTPAEAVEAPAAPVGLMETKAVEQEQPSSAPEQVVSEAVPPVRLARKVRPRKVAESAEAVNAEAPVETKKAAAAKKVVEVTEPKAKKAKAKKAKKAVAKKANTKKAKAAKSKKTPSAAKGTKKAAPKKAATKKAAAKKTAKKASNKKAAKKTAAKPPAAKSKKKKKKAR